MKENITQEVITSGAIGRPWWQVRGTLWLALLVVCAAPVALAWWNDEFREALLTGLVLPFASAIKPLLQSAVLAVLAGSTSVGLLIGWVWRRVHALRAPALATQTA